jgi:hypothetical protein
MDVLHKPLWRTTDGREHELQPTALSASDSALGPARLLWTADIRFPERVEWNAVPAKLLACLKAAIEALPDLQRERVLDDFER